MGRSGNGEQTATQWRELLCILGLHENEEWRISFSQAEYKFVCAMNHCQFLTFGLLKLFLK